jgi:hypothetical protein
LPEASTDSAELNIAMVDELIKAGLYKKEAQAMVKTWQSAWFGDNGTRLLYILPSSQTEKLLPLAVEPRPTETVRVLVGRHDFLTPEQETEGDHRLERIRAARVELEDLQKEMLKLGRFAAELAQKRLEKRTAVNGEK